MKGHLKEIVAILVTLLSGLAAAGAWQLTGGNVAIQIGGSQNKIEQKVEVRNQLPPSK